MTTPAAALRPEPARLPASAAGPVDLAPSDPARWLALGAAVGPVLFTLAWIVLGLLQPATMTPYGVAGGISGAISQPISGLGVGPHAAPFNAAFVLCGLIQLVGAVAVVQTAGSGGRTGARVACAALLAVSPLALTMAGVFTLESALPLHILAGTVLFVAPVAGFLVAGLYFRRIPGWRRFGTRLLLGSPLTLLLFVVYSASFDQAAIAAGQGAAGLTERLLLLEIQAWYVAMGWLAFRRP